MDYSWSGLRGKEVEEEEEELKRKRKGKKRKILTHLEEAVQQEGEPVGEHLLSHRLRSAQTETRTHTHR